MADQNLVSLNTPDLAVEIDPSDLAAHVTVKSTGDRFEMAGAQEDDVMMMSSGAKVWKTFRGAVASTQRTDSSFTAELPSLGLRVSISVEGAEVLFEVAPAEGGDGSVPREVLYPRHFILPQAKGNYAVFPFGMGCILPSDKFWNFNHREGYAEATMNWIGGYAGKTGFAAIVETPHDLYQAVDERPGHAASCFIHWMGTLGKLGYARRIRYRFEAGLDYVKQAKLYREYTRKIGWFKSLEEKVAENPNVAQLKGSPIVTVPIASRRERQMTYDVQTFDHAATLVEQFSKTTGIKTGVVHVDGWGYWGYDAMHPDVLPVNGDAGGPAGLADMAKRVKQLGFLFGLHDQYIDFYAHAPSYDQSKSIVLEDGSPIRVNRWCGGLCGHLSYGFIPGYVRRNYYQGVKRVYPIYHNSRSIWDICEPTASYLDCFGRTVEDWSSDHPMTREQAREFEVEALGIVRGGKDGKMIVQSDEHPRDYALRVLDFGWGIGHMTTDVPNTTGEMTTTRLGIDVPFWHLCFHDAIALPLPKDDLATQFLYAQAPYFMLGMREQFGKKEYEEYSTGMKKEVLKLHSDVGFSEMTGFENLEEDGSVQKSVFGDVEVTLDRRKGTVEISGGQAATKRPIKLPKTDKSAKAKAKRAKKK